MQNKYKQNLDEIKILFDKKLNLLTVEPFLQEENHFSDVKNQLIFLQSHLYFEVKGQH